MRIPGRVSANSFFNTRSSDREPSLLNSFHPTRSSRDSRIHVSATWIEWRNGPVGAKRQRRTRVEQRTKGVGCLRPFFANSLFGPTPVVDRVIRLHRGNDSVACETWYSPAAAGAERVRCGSADLDHRSPFQPVRRSSSIRSLARSPIA